MLGETGRFNSKIIPTITRQRPENETDKITCVYYLYNQVHLKIKHAYILITKENSRLVAIQNDRFLIDQNYPNLFAAKQAFEIFYKSKHKGMRPRWSNSGLELKDLVLTLINYTYKAHYKKQPDFGVQN